jgi:hypothetical protein
LALEIDYRRKTRTMAAVGAGVFLATVDGSIIHAPPPTLVRALNTEFSVWCSGLYRPTCQRLPRPSCAFLFGARRVNDTPTSLPMLGCIADAPGRRFIRSTGECTLSVL